MTGRRKLPTSTVKMSFEEEGAPKRRPIERRGTVVSRDILGRLH
jgi:hypothetical protein